MSRILRLRQWLTLAEAARLLSTLVSEEVSESDLLRLAIDRQLTLSVHFPNGVHVRQWLEVDMSDVKWMEVPSAYGDGVDRWVEDAAIRILHGAPMQATGPVYLLEGVLDIPMLGAEENEVERAYQLMHEGSLKSSPTPRELVLQSEAYLYIVQEMREDGEERDADGRKPTAFSSQRFVPAKSLSGDAVFVVRTESLMALQAKLADPVIAKQPADQLGTKERETLLKLVVGMAIMGYGWNPKAAKSSTVTEIVGDLAKQKIDISDDTVRTWLRKAANAVLPQ